LSDFKLKSVTLTRGSGKACTTRTSVADERLAFLRTATGECVLKLVVTLLTALGTAFGPNVCPCRVMAVACRGEESAGQGLSALGKPRCGCHRHSAKTSSASGTMQSPKLPCHCDHPPVCALPLPRSTTVSWSLSGDDSLWVVDFGGPAHSHPAVLREQGDIGTPLFCVPWFSSREFLRFTHSLRC
jgi:hypothetical protein